jgi:hypothetical protein
MAFGSLIHCENQPSFVEQSAYPESEEPSDLQAHGYPEDQCAFLQITGGNMEQCWQRVSRWPGIAIE